MTKKIDSNGKSLFLMPESARTLSFSDREVISCGITKVSKGLSSALSSTVSPEDLTSSEASLILKLDLGLTSPGDISACMGIDATNLSRVIRSSEDKGLITREVDDTNRSKVILGLTREGQKKVDRVKPKIQAMEKKTMSALSEKEAADLKRLLQKMCVSLVENDYI